MSHGGKGGGGEATVGYRYYMGVQLAVCHGPVDSVNRIIIGEREAWVGSVTGSATISINKPDLFGGDNREGGVVGAVDVCMGDMNQGRNAYLTTYQSADCPSYRGLLTVLFKAFRWSSGNPYFKAPWIEATRILADWEGGTPWNAEDAVIVIKDVPPPGVGYKDMNPAHIIYQALTDPAWGMGYSTSDIGEASFHYAADMLVTEKFGLSLSWDSQSSIEEFVQEILTHINGALGLNLATGKFELKLVRGDYDIGSLTELNSSNILQMKSFQRAAIGDAPNEIVVIYTDRDGNEKPVAVQNLARVQAQGAVISTTRKYIGIRDPDLAARVAQRDLNTLSTDLAYCTLTCNRVLWDKEKGDVVKLVWPRRGVNGVAFRITDIRKGTLTDSKIEVDMIEDVFGLPNAVYTTTPETEWYDTVVPPVAADAGIALEAPYWEIVKRINLADRDKLESAYGFGLFLAARGAVNSPLGYTLSASADNLKYEDVGSGHFSPTGLLASSVSPEPGPTTITLTGAYDLDGVVLSADGGYAVVDDEFISVISCDPETGVVQIGRGILDTVPAAHSNGARVFFITLNAAYDPTERTDGETVYYKPRPTTGLGTLDVNEATADVLAFGNRASRPYPPGNFKIGGQSYPGSITGPGVAVTWSHRDRAAQTVDFVDNTVGNIGPEPGTTYRMRVYAGDTLLRTYDMDGTTTSWAYPSADDDADGNLATLRLELRSVRDGLESRQAQKHTFTRIEVTGNVGIEGRPATPDLLATQGAYAIDIAWAFGDSRTNIKHTEIWVSSTPDFEDGTVLIYVDYLDTPNNSYTHELEQVGAYRWYWARVADVSGQLSDWSTMRSARAGFSSVSPATMLTEINTLLKDGSGTAKIELLADRFSISAPDGAKTPFAVVDTGGGVYKTLINSDVLFGGNVDIANLKTGDLPENVMMRLGGGMVEIDGQGEIRAYKALGGNQDFVRLSAGELRFLRYIEGTGFVTYNFLSRIEVGVANNGDVVQIPGYWKQQPKVMVSPASLTLYMQQYANQNQAITCGAGGLEESPVGSGKWRFTATATLNLAANTGTTGVNETSGDVSVNTWTSTTKTTAANCVNITPSLSVKSQRGNGTSQWYYRSIRWRVEYWNGSAWVALAWRVVNMGAQFSAITDSGVFSFPSSGTWQWRIYVEDYDTDGTIFGSISYNYNQETLNGATFQAVSSVVPYDANNPKTVGATSSLPARTISGEIYKMEFHWSASWSGAGYWSGGVLWAVFTAKTKCAGSSGTLYDNASATLPQVTTWSGSGPARTHTITGSNLSYSGHEIYAEATTQNQSSNLGTETLTVTVASPSVTIYTRTPTPNSTTPTNNTLINSYGYNLASAQVLASGALNWTATGE